MKIKSSFFDEIEFDDKDIIVLEQGMIGMPDMKKFVLMEFADESAFHWLQSVDEPDMGFIVTEPIFFDENYTIAVDAKASDLLKIEKDDDIVVMAIVTIKDKGDSITGNLLGPIVINANKRIGTQMVLDPAIYSTIAPLRQAENMEESEKVTAECTA